MSPSTEIVKVWLKVVFTEKGVIAWVKNYGQVFVEASEARELYELNCKDKKAKILDRTIFSKGNDVVYSNNSPSEWFFIIPDSFADGLYKILCK